VAQDFARGTNGRPLRAWRRIPSARRGSARTPTGPGRPRWAAPRRAARRRCCWPAPTAASSPPPRPNRSGPALPHRGHARRGPPLPPPVPGRARHIRTIAAARGEQHRTSGSGHGGAPNLTKTGLPDPSPASVRPSGGDPRRRP
jgi:hypothetical protein